jgi:hypothetical protein
MIRLHLQKPINRVRLFVRVDNVVVSPAHNDQVLETVAVSRALLRVMSGAARPRPFYVADFANDRAAFDQRRGALRKGTAITGVREQALDGRVARPCGVTARHREICLCV